MALRAAMIREPIQARLARPRLASPSPAAALKPPNVPPRRAVGPYIQAADVSVTKKQQDKIGKFRTQFLKNHTEENYTYREEIFDKFVEDGPTLAEIKKFVDDDKARPVIGQGGAASSPPPQPSSSAPSVSTTSTSSTPVSSPAPAVSTTVSALTPPSTPLTGKQKQKNRPTPVASNQLGFKTTTSPSPGTMYSANTLQHQVDRPWENADITDMVKNTAKPSSLILHNHKYDHTSVSGDTDYYIFFAEWPRTNGVARGTLHLHYHPKPNTPNYLHVKKNDASGPGAGIIENTHWLITAIGLDPNDVKRG
jgi:hypothetical protein